MSSITPSSAPPAHRGAGKKSKRKPFSKKPFSEPPNPTNGLVPILHNGLGPPGTTNNFDEFQMALPPYMEKIFEPAGRCFRDGSYPDIPSPIYTTDSSNASEGRIHRHRRMHEAKGKIVLDRRERVRSQKSQLFALLEGLLSVESSEAVKAHEDYQEALDDRDPLALYIIILDTHRVGNHGVAAFDIDAASVRFWNLKMQPHEDISTYSRRFQTAVKDLEHLGGAVPALAEQLIRLLNSLPSNYDPIKLHIQNRKRESGDDFLMPATYGTMVSTIQRLGNELQCNLRPRHEGPRATAVAFHAKGEQKKQHKPATANANVGKKSAGRLCALCGVDQHWADSCPNLAVAKAAVQAANHTLRMTISVSGTIMRMNTRVDFDVYSEFTILLDNQSTLHLFCDIELLTTIESFEPAIRVSGVGHGSVNVNSIGTFGAVGRVYYHSNAGANVLSFSVLKRTGWALRYDDVVDQFTATYGDSSMVFGRMDEADGTLYCCKVRVRTDHAVHAINTVDGNKRHFSRSEVISADKTRDAMSRLGFPSEDRLKLSLVGGGIVNSDLTVRGLEVARQIYGPHLALVKGTTKRRKGVIYPDVTVPLTVRSIQDIYFDIMIINNTEKFLISVSKPLGLLMSNYLKTKDAHSVEKELVAQIDGYKARHFSIKTAHCDSESTLVAQTSALATLGIVLVTAAPSTHCVIVERYIGVARDGLRKILCMLPYTLPRSLLKWAVAYFVRFHNSFPSASSNIGVSPRELFTGRKLDFKRDAPAAFGAYAQVFVPTAGKMESRTEAGLAMLPTGNRHAGIHFYLVASGHVLVRNQYQLLPMPSELIEEINRRAATESGAKTPISWENPDIVLERSNGHNRSVQAFEDVIQPVVFDPTHSVVAPATPENDIEYQPILPLGPGLWSAVPPVLDQGGMDPPVLDAHVDVQPELDPAVSQVGDPATVSIDNIVDDDTTQDANPTSLQDDSPISSSPIVTTSSGRVSRQNQRYKDATISGRAMVKLHMHTFFARIAESEDRISMFAESLQMKDNFCFRLTVKRAIEKFGPVATAAICKELCQLLLIPAFIPVKRNSVPTKKQLIRSMMFLKEKVKADGSFEKLKARLVARGDMQEQIEDDDKSSPTVATTAAFAVAAIAAGEERDVATLDVTGAFLQAPIEAEEIYIIIERDIAAMLIEVAPVYGEYIYDPGGTITVKLVRALYGCKQSALLWYSFMVKKLKSIGFVPNPAEPCVLNRGDVLSETQETIAVHVDDFLITTQKKANMDRLLAELKSAFVDVTVHREKVFSYLGMTFNFSEPGKVRICMDGYVQDFLKDNEVSSSSPTPASNKLFEIDSTSKPLDVNQAKHFHTSVARLLYLAKRTRPDILLPVNFLCTRVANPTEDDARKLERVTKYLYGTRELGICLQLNSSSKVRLDSYVDASYATHADAKGHSGIFVAIGGGPIFVRSSKQKLVAKSSTEAELIALSEATSQVVWCREFLLAQGYDIGPARIFQDNKSTMQLADKGRSTSDRTKHINVRYFFVHDRMESGEISLEYMPTEEMVADILTKPLQGALFMKLRNMLMNWSVVSFDALTSRDHVERKQHSA